MHRPTALLALSGALALAADSSSTTVVGLWMPFLGDLDELAASPIPLSASVVGVDAKATTYSLGCPGGTEAEECPNTDTMVFTQGPSTYAWAAVGHPETDMAVSETLACSAPGDEDTLVCTATIAESDGTTALVKHESITTSGFVTNRISVTLTAGLEKLSATPGATGSGSAGATNTAKATATGAAASSAGTSAGASQTGKSAQSSASGSGAAAAPTSTSGANAGVAMNVRGGVLVGMGAVIGGLML